MNLRETCKAIINGYAAGKSGFDDDMIQYLIELGDKANEVIQLIDQLQASDMYLRDIRAENLDGSEPALGEILNVNLELLRSDLP